MPKLTPLGPHHWGYKCQCGKDMEIFTDASDTEKLERVTKCWECLCSDGMLQNITEVA